jgi:methyl-accepting chemotaxis protein
MIRLHIRAKFFLVLVSLIVLFVPLFLIFFINSTEEVTRAARLYVQEVSGNYAYQVQSDLEQARSISKTVAQIFQNYESIPVKDRRGIFNQILKNVASENPRFQGFWTIWEPQALDGRDGEFSGKAGYDETGRFQSYYYYNQEKKLEFLEEPELLEETDTYYHIPLKTGKETLLEPYEDPDIHVLMTTVAIPILVKGRVVGVVGIDIALSSIQEKVSSIKPYETGVAALYSNGGTVAAHFDEKRVGKKMTETEWQGTGVNMEQILEKIRSGTPFSFSLFSIYLNQDLFLSLSPIRIGESETPWAFVAAVPLQKVLENVARMKLIFYMAGGAGLVLMLLILLQFSSSIIRPLNQLKEMLKKIASGQGDLTRKIFVKSRDEIREVADDFNLFIHKLKSLIINLKSHGETLKNSSEDNTFHAEETVLALQGVSASIQSTLGNIEKEKAMIEDSNRRIVGILRNIETIEKMNEEIQRGMGKASEDFNGMALEVEECSKEALKASDASGALKQVSGQGRKTMESLALSIEEVSKNSDSIKEMVQLIMDISEQTNLLAMNAAIEAAHAGEYGKGFAVVAEEIRKLADKSGKSAREIQGVVSGIAENINQNQKLSGQAGENFKELNQEIEKVKAVNEKIAGVLAAQKNRSREISGFIVSLNRTMEHLMTEMRKQVQDGKNIEGALEKLDLLSREIAASMKEDEKNLSEVSESVDFVSQNSKVLKMIAGSIQRDFNQFKTEEEEA